jgi:hypothetical protein
MSIPKLMKAALLASVLSSVLLGPAALLYSGAAFAKGGDSSGSGGDDDNSGRGGGDDDSSGPGSGDDDDDDNSGPGGGDDDDDDDDHSGSGGDDDDDRSGPGSDWSGPAAYHGRVVRIEVRGGAIEVRYADGSRERIANGRYEFRDASGRSERHTATGADIARLQKIAREAGAIPAEGNAQRARVERYEMRRGGIALYYSNGWTESVEAGTYLLVDPFKRTITRRAATRADLDRLIELAGDRP